MDSEFSFHVLIKGKPTPQIVSEVDGKLFIVVNANESFELYAHSKTKAPDSRDSHFFYIAATFTLDEIELPYHYFIEEDGVYIRGFPEVGSNDGNNDRQLLSSERSIDESNVSKSIPPLPKLICRFYTYKYKKIQPKVLPKKHDEVKKKPKTQESKKPEPSMKMMKSQKKRKSSYLK